jgi:hypothetical protein
MVEHIVLFRWKEDATPEAIAKVFDGLRALKGKIPGLVELTCGPDFSGRARGFTHGMVVRFVDRAALETYLPHPLHREVITTWIDPIRADVMACDFEC